MTTKRKVDWRHNHGFLPIAMAAIIFVVAFSFVGGTTW
jgi:hypothetical protein